VLPREKTEEGGQQFPQQQRSPQRDNHIICKTLQLQEPKPIAVPKEGQAKSMPFGVGSRDSYKGWKLVASGTRRKDLDLLADLQVLKRFITLTAGKGLGAVSSEASELAESECCNSNQDEVATDSSV